MESAAERRERLKALKEAARLAEQSGAAEGAVEGATGTAAAGAAQEPEKPVLKFRNYVVKDQRIEHEQVISRGNRTYRPWPDKRKANNLSSSPAEPPGSGPCQLQTSHGTY
jgi:hypothetical protein